MSLTVEEFYGKYKKAIGLELFGGKGGLSRKIGTSEVYRPGLSLSGYLKNMIVKGFLLFGKVEISYLKELSSSKRLERLQAILQKKIVGVVVARKFAPLKEMIQICKEREIPIFLSEERATVCFSKMNYFLNEVTAPEISMHGTLVELFGIGVFIQGASSVGKSETALGLIERGHRLISDDLVRIRKKESCFLEGRGPELGKHLIEIRGIGIINVAHLYGAVSVRDAKGIDLVIRIEEWNKAHFYDRVGLEEKSIEILEVAIPFYVLPIKPGRDVVLLMETLVLNHRLKQMGYHSAKEFNNKLLEALAKKSKRGKLGETFQKI